MEKCSPNLSNNFCLSQSFIVDEGGEFIFNTDGTLSVFINDGNNLIPYNKINTKICCEFNGFIFDENKQKCRWANPIDCEDCDKKIVIYSQNNLGSEFSVSEEENIQDDCTLEISFDYLFKFNCDVFSSGTTESEEYLNIVEQINQLEGELEILDCESIKNQCDEYTQLYEQACYPIQILVDNEFIICCLTEQGLIRWQSILGDVLYNEWFNNDGCVEIDLSEQSLILYNEGKNIALDNSTQNPYLIEFENTTNLSNNPLCEKKGLKDQKISFCNDYQTCLEYKEDLINSIEDLNNQLLETNTSLCQDPITNLENIEISLNLDVETDTVGLYETVYEELFYNIGEGNLIDYILETEGNTGINVFTFDSEGNKTPINDLNCDTNIICTNNLNTFMDSLYQNQYIEKFGEITNKIERIKVENLLKSWFKSEWKRLNLNITNESVIEKIKNRNIRISLKINNCCYDFDILLDNIKLIKNCETTQLIPIKIDKPIGFNLNKIIDNKKSWLEVNDLTNRKLLLDKRYTNYDIQDSKKIINTKEIDLNIDSARAIESDLFKFIKFNKDLLKPNTGITECYYEEDYYEEDYYECKLSDCGDSNIDLTEINNLEFNHLNDFINYIQTYLIDVKSRQTIGSYPLLRLLYDRYLHTINSNSYTYESMYKISKLINRYWVELVEQFVPSTTIWGSTEVYRNTIFNTQKHKYKNGNLILCGNNSLNECDLNKGLTVLTNNIQNFSNYQLKFINIINNKPNFEYVFPNNINQKVILIFDNNENIWVLKYTSDGNTFTDVAKSDNLIGNYEPLLNEQVATVEIVCNTKLKNNCETSVIITNITSDFTINDCEEVEYCDCVDIYRSGCSSEFINFINDIKPEDDESEDDCNIKENITLKIETDSNCNDALIQTWNQITNVFTQRIEVFENNILIDELYDYNVTSYGPNNVGIYFTITNITNTGFDLNWHLPPNLSPTLNPNQSDCKIYYLIPIDEQRWDVKPIINIYKEECLISSEFIGDENRDNNIDKVKNI